MDSKHLKILYIHHGSVNGGAPTSLRNMIGGLLKENYHADLTVARVYPSMIPFFKEVQGIKVKQYVVTDTLLGRYLMGWSKISVRGLFFLGICLFTALPSILAQIRYIQSESPDLLHLNSSILWSSGIAGKLSQVPVIWHIREASDDPKYNLVRILYAEFIKKISAKVLCIGPKEYESIRGKGSENVEMIYNSLDDSYFTENQNRKDEIRKKINLPADKFIFLSLGGNSFRNGPYQLIESLKYLDNECACVIAGPRPQNLCSKPGILVRNILKIEDKLFRKDLKKYFIWQYAHRLSISLDTSDFSRLFLPGVLKNVKPYIRACDVLVFPGTYPHSARPIYEAWALKKPVIGFDSKVMRQDIDDGVNGLIVKNHTPEALAQALSWLKNHPKICEKMGREGYKKAVRRFSLKKNTAKLIKVYQSIA